MDQERIKQIVVETEAAAQKVLIDKEELIGLDFRRQKTREAYRALKNADKSNEKTWMSIGSLFIKVRSDKAQVLLQRDLDELDKEINELRDGLKDKVNKLRDIEGKPELQGFNLKPLTNEIQAITQALLPH